MESDAQFCARASVASLLEPQLEMQKVMEIDQAIEAEMHEDAHGVRACARACVQRLCVSVSHRLLARRQLP